MKPTPAPFTVSATRIFGRSPARASSSSRAADRAATSLPSHRATSQPNARSFASRSPWSETSATQVSDWILLWSDDRGDLAEALVRRLGQRLPELTLLELAVAGEHPDAAALAPEAGGASESLRLRDPHPERPGVRVHLGRGRDVRMARQAAEPAQPVELLERKPLGPDQHRIERGRVVALRGVVDVVAAQHLEVQPRHDVDRAEARADVARARPHDHVEDVDPAGVGEGVGALDRIGVEPAQAAQLVERHVAQVLDLLRRCYRCGFHQAATGRRAAPVSTIRSAWSQSDG